jgi:hypothetical protein
MEITPKRGNSEEAGSGQQLCYQLAGDIGQAEIATLESVGEPGVIETQQVQQGGVKVMDKPPFCFSAP